MINALTTEPNGNEILEYLIILIRVAESNRFRENNLSCLTRPAVVFGFTARARKNATVANSAFALHFGDSRDTIQSNRSEINRRRDYENAMIMGVIK